MKWLFSESRILNLRSSSSRAKKEIYAYDLRPGKGDRNLNSNWLIGAMLICWLISSSVFPFVKWS